MRVRFAFGLGVAVIGIGVAASAFAQKSPSSVRETLDRPAVAQADCSRTTATQLVQRFHLNNFEVADPVEQVLCGPFTGPGSEAMAVAIGGAPTCWPVQRWAVFSFSNGAWKLVLDQPSFLIPPLVAVGSDIKETTPVYRVGDARCTPSGGTQARTWHWDGTRLVAGAWTQVTAGKPLTSMDFDSPRAISTRCAMSDRPRVHGSYAVEALCQSGKARPALYQKVRLGGNGVLAVCRTHKTSGCNLLCGCEEHVPILAYGQHVDVGRFRCESLRTGVRCTIIRTGRGFLINRDRVTRVGP
jgi:hypothetical protein